MRVWWVSLSVSVVDIVLLIVHQSPFVLLPFSVVCVLEKIFCSNYLFNFFPLHSASN